MIYYIVGERGKSTFLKSLGFPICRTILDVKTSIMKTYKNICIDDVCTNEEFLNLIKIHDGQVSLKINEFIMNKNGDLNFYISIHPIFWEKLPLSLKEKGIVIQIEQKEN